ncbi:kinesin-like protein KIN-6 isoform X5 [Panicum virgatum]|uniref:kinesin-like protein KIN-6 isoform X5 n=1 Tax=Panicum virgatum TaxID=38727 RepID=UPI0019D538CA|nr:kinesin-like protein KIN-6 isoform X5 [Panicum virgatum]
MEPAAAPPEPASPPPPTTVRRNPPRRARPPPTPLASAKPKPKPSSLSRFLQYEAAASIPTPPPSSSSPQEERLKVFLRIRPLPVRDHCKAVPRPMPAKDPRRKPKQAGGADLCLVPTGPNSVALTVPQSKLVDPKRGRTEVFDGFSAVFPPDSTQLDIFVQVMNPLVDDFLGGKSGLLVAMGPTGSGKTHTIFGSPRNPGILPLTLQQIFKAQDENKVASQPATTRSFSLSMFEILSEGKGERILDLLSDAAECVLQQSSIKGLQEVPLSNLADAESLVSRGMLKRSTAATNANSNSSRSQCIITIHGIHKSSDADSEHLLSNAVLTIADLAGAERERKTGNQGSRLLESNFINNTSMVFGLCLRSLLEYQKNQKKPLEKHFKNSMLTRYLRDYLEGRKKMTLVLNVKPANDDYLDTSFLLRQASPYMKIKYTSLEDSSDLVTQKRSNASLICQENKKKRKVQKPEVLGVERKENVETDNIAKVSEEDDKQHKFLNSELRRVSRSEAIMTNFARALWTVLKQYKHKLLESENAAESMTQLIRDQDIQIVELKKELEVLNSCCSSKNIPVTEDTSIDQDDSVSSGQAGRSLVSLSNKPNLGSYDASVDNFHLVAEDVSKELKSHGPENSSAPCSMNAGESISCDTSSISLIDEQELSSRGLKSHTEEGNTKVEVQAIHKKLDASECFTEQTSAHTGGVTLSSSHSDNQSDQSLTEHHMLPCLKTERVNLFPQFTSCSKKATIEQSEDEIEELSKITVEDIRHDVSIREVKHPDYLSSCQRVSSDTEDVSSSQSSLELLGMVAPQKKLAELDLEPERCEPGVVNATVECAGHSQAPEQMSDCGGRVPCLLKEITCPVKASKAPSKVSEADEAADKKKEGFACRPQDTKKTRRKLQPATAMMLKEFTSADLDVDTKREERGKSSSGVASGRSDALIRLLKARPVRRV